MAVDDAQTHKLAVETARGGKTSIANREADYHRVMNNNIPRRNPPDIDYKTFIRNYAEKLGKRMGCCSKKSISEIEKVLLEDDINTEEDYYRLGDFSFIGRFDGYFMVCNG